MLHVIFNLLWLDAATDTEPDLCRQVLLYSVFIIALQICLKPHLPRFEKAKYRIGTRLGTSRRDFTRFTTFREGEVQDWERIWDFAPGVHQLNFVGSPAYNERRATKHPTAEENKNEERENYFRFLQKSN